MKKIIKKLIFTILYITTISFLFMMVCIPAFDGLAPSKAISVNILNYSQLFIYCLLLLSILYIVFFNVRKRKSSLIARITAWMGWIFILLPYPFIFTYVRYFGLSLGLLIILTVLDGLYYLLAKKLVDEKREVGESNENLQL